MAGTRLCEAASLHLRNEATAFLLSHLTAPSPMPARYRLQNHPAFEGLLSKEDLYLLVERGSVARGDFCLDARSGRAHKVGELIDGMAPPRAGSAASRIDRPVYREIRADGPSSGEPEMDDDVYAEDEDGEASGEDEDGLPRTDGGEVIHFRGHPSWLAYAKPLFLALLLVIAAAVSFPFGEIYLAVGSGLALFTLLCVAAVRFSCDYIVTEERVETVWGIFGRSSKEVRIRDIRAIDVHESGFWGLLGIGTVDFSSAGTAGVEVQFKQVRRAHEVKRLVRDLQKAACE